MAVSKGHHRRRGSITGVTYWLLAVLQCQLDFSQKCLRVSIFKRTQPYTELLGSYMIEERVLQLPGMILLRVSFYWVSRKFWAVELKQEETNSWKAHCLELGVNNLFVFSNIIICCIVPGSEHKVSGLCKCSGMWNCQRKTLGVPVWPVVELDHGNNMGGNVTKCHYFSDS